MKHLTAWKVHLFLIVVMSGFIFSACEAQAVIGKWNRVSGKKYFTSDYAKTEGKKFVEISIDSDGVEVMEFRPDHSYTYTLTSKNQVKPIVLAGTWSVSGDLLYLKLNAKQANPKYNPKYNVDEPMDIFTVDGNNLTLSADIPDNNPLKTQLKIEKMQEVFVKL
jgi:hypothetical protein